MARLERDRYIFRVTCLYAGGAALWIVLSDRLLSLIRDPALTSWLHLARGLAFVVFTSLLLVAVLRRTPADAAPALPGAREPRWPLFAALGLTVLAIALIAGLTYRSQAAALAEDAHADLEAVARLKVDGVKTWLDERRTDAATISHNPLTLQLLARWLERRDEPSRAQLAALLQEALQWSRLSNVTLLDAQGRVLLDAGGSPGISRQTLAALRQAEQSGDIVMDDLQVDAATGLVRLGFVAPLYSGSGEGRRLLGAALLQARADDYLYPYLGTWPKPDSGGETLLLRRDGDAVLVLNPPRREPHAPLTLRLPLDAPDLASARAMRGRNDASAALDYRGVRVLSAALVVPGTPWVLLAKEDEAETLQGMQRLAVTTALLTVAALVAAFSFIAYLWQQQRLRGALRSMQQARALRSAETHFRALFEQSAASIGEMSPDGRWLRVNQRMCQMLGLTQARLLQHNFRDPVHPDDLKACERLLRQLQEGGADQGHLDLRYNGPRGLAWASASVSAVRGADGELDCFVVAAQDITALKAAEASLQQRVNLQEYLGKIASSLPGSIYSFRMRPDGAMSMPFTSPNFREVCGVDSAAVAGDAGPAFALIHPDDLAAVKAGILESAHTGTQWQAQFRLRHPERGEVWIEGRSMPEVEADGSVLWHGFLYDISLRKQGEARQRLAASVFSSTQEGVVITDPRANIVAVNPAFCAITGYGEDELLGRHMRIMQSGLQDAAFYRQMWNTIISAGYWQGEIWNRRKSGANYPQWLTISAVRDDSGATVNYVGSFSDISRLKESEDRLRFLAHHDPLTGLPNRQALLQQLDQALARAQRSGQPGAVLFLDLDRFKNINDSFGHPAGDELLKLAAQRMGASLRQTDVLARLGGDEFLVLLEDVANPADVAKLAQGLIAAVSRPFSLHDGKEASVGASIGISLFPRDAAEAHQLIQQADAALYQAKAAGRGVYRFFETELTRIALRRLEIEARIRRGLERGEFLLHYQPLVDLASGRATGAEALARWRSAAGELMSPAEFIPVAEETGLIIPLGEWVLRTACRQMKDWLDAGLPLQAMAVNLSPQQFRRADLVERIEAALRETGLPAAKLELELTEGILMDSGSEAEQKLQRLKRLGVRLSIDDFGTGYSSLAYLKRFPIDKLKIDRQFVHDIPQDSADMQIAAAIVSLGHNLGLEVLAEGIETPAQLEFLRSLNCDTGQGFLFSRPLAAREFAGALSDPARTLTAAA